MKNIIFYLDNGDTYLGDNYTIKDAIKKLKQEGYTKYYQGIRYFDNKKDNVIVGIDDNNKVLIPERRKNGLLYARCKNI